MNGRTKLGGLAGLLAGMALLAGCHSGGSNPHPVTSALSAHPSAAAALASARAHARALVTSAPVMAAERKIAPKAVSCAASEGLHMTLTGAGTPQMRANVSNVPFGWVLHPVKDTEKLGRCMGLTAADVTTLKAYAKTEVFTNGIGKGEGTKDFTAIVLRASQLVAGH